jgi:CheY-like chemotaxis protein
MLVTLGYQVCCARNGEQALQIHQDGEKFELLFSDVVMPNGINGVELARQVRHRDKDIKILLTSGYAGEVLEKYQAVGEFPIIDKPFRRVDLAQRVRSILCAA